MAKKRANWSKQKAEFNSSLNSSSFDDFFSDSSNSNAHRSPDIFEKERKRTEKAQQEKEAASRYKACESKQRYTSATEAKATIADCERHGTYGLNMYKCPHCNGWHLTSKKY